MKIFNSTFRFIRLFLFIFSGSIILIIEGYPSVPGLENIVIVAAMIVAGCLGFSS